MNDYIKLAAPDRELEDISTGLKYRFSALNFKEISEYCLWYQYKDYTDAKKIGIDDKELLRDIYKTCRSKSYSYEDNELIKSMLTPDGMRKILYIGIRRNHPEVTEAIIDGIVNVVNIEDVAVQVMEQAGYTDTSFSQKEGNESGE